MQRVLLAILIAGCWSSSPAPAPKTTPPPAVASRPPPPPPVRTPDCFETAIRGVLPQRPYDCAVECFAARDYASADRLVEYLAVTFPYSSFVRKGELIRADILVEKRDFAGAVKAYEVWLKGNVPADEREAVERKRNLARASLNAGR